MEDFDTVAEFLVSAFEETVSWDVTECLFYGLVTISIWLIIKVFIEISETREETKNNVSTRRRLTEGSIATTSEVREDEDHKTTKKGARVRFDLSKNEGYVFDSGSENNEMTGEDGFLKEVAKQKASMQNEDEGFDEFLAYVAEQKALIEKEKKKSMEIREQERKKRASMQNEEGGFDKCGSKEMDMQNDEGFDEFLAYVAEQKALMEKEKKKSKEIREKERKKKASMQNQDNTFRESIEKAAKQKISMENEEKRSIKIVEEDLKKKASMQNQDNTFRESIEKAAKQKISMENEEKRSIKIVEEDLKKKASTQNQNDASDKYIEKAAKQKVSMENEEKRSIKIAEVNLKKKASMQNQDNTFNKFVEKAAKQMVSMENKEKRSIKIVEEDLKKKASMQNQNDASDKFIEKATKQKISMENEEKRSIKIVEEEPKKKASMQNEEESFDEFLAYVAEQKALIEKEKKKSMEIREQERKKRASMQNEKGGFDECGSKQMDMQNEEEGFDEFLAYVAEQKALMEKEKKKSKEIREKERKKKASMRNKEEDVDERHYEAVNSELVYENEFMPMLDDTRSVEDMSEDSSESKDKPGEECAEENELEIMEEIEGGKHGTGTSSKVNASMDILTSDVPHWFARVEVSTKKYDVKDDVEMSRIQSLIELFESLQESNGKSAVKTRRIRRYQSMPSLRRRSTVRTQESNGDSNLEGETKENTSVISSGEDHSKISGSGSKVKRSKSVRDWKDDLLQSYKTGYRRMAMGLSFYQRPEEPEEKEELIQQTFGAVLKPTLPQPEPVPYEVTCRTYSPEERNLLKNNCGQNGLSDWTSKYRLLDWNVAEVENALLPTDGDGNSLIECDTNVTFFEAKSRKCRKEQEIDLISEGFNAEFLDKEQPQILVSEWVEVLEHCKSTYELRVKLLDEKRQTVAKFQKDLSFNVRGKSKWEKISHVFEGYGPGVRYILFNHGAVKWYGANGCRLTGAVVRVLNPN